MVTAIGTLLVVSMICAGADERRKRVAVLDFEYGTVRSEVASAFGTDVDVGKGVADLLAKHLVKDGTYSVIERKALETYLKGQEFQARERSNLATAAQIGKSLGIDAIIVGTITQFGGETARKAAVGGTIIAGVERKQEATKATVTLDARVVCIDTGEILAVAEGKGESTRSGKSYYVGSISGGWGVDFSSSKFQETILGEAVKAAVEDMSAGIIAANARLVMRKVDVEGLVAFIEGSTVVLNIGSKSDLKRGDRLSVERVTKEIRDPKSGNVIRRLTDAIGVVEVTEVDEASALCRVLSGADFKVGDLARPIVK